MDASLIKKLKDMTNAGLMDCKKALEENNGDIDEAIKWLREKGISKAAKKQDRIAAEGLSNILVEGNKAVIVEVNCETDFVAKNEKFSAFIDRLCKTLINGDAKTMEEAEALKEEDGTTIKDDVINMTATIGEKISFRRFNVLTKTDDQTFGRYIHMNGKISSLTLINGNNGEVAADVAMHLAAMNPKYVSRDVVPASDIEEESKIIKEQAMNEGKPEEIAEKMVAGRINKFYKDIVITEQEFVKNPDITVGTYLKNNNCELVDMIRYEVGEGIEKRKDDFVNEVMEQMK